MSLMRWITVGVAVWCGASATAEQPVVPLQWTNEVWRSSGFEPANTDSLAAARVRDRTVVYATAKEGDRIDLLDATDGRWLGRVGERGDGPLQFRRPNGVIVVPVLDIEHAVHGEPGPLILVIERDGRRVQGFWADTLEHAGTFGSGELIKPYGGAVSFRDNQVTLFVTDNDVPPDQVVKRYRLARSGRSIRAEFLGVIGDADGPGAVLKSESIAVDDRLGRVLLCDEDKSQKNVKVYTLDGQFTGTTFGDKLIFGDPEGIIVHDDPSRGFVLLTDQQAMITIWHVFDRQSYTHLAAFTGKPFLANTDGIAWCSWPVPGHPSGLLFAVHDDADVRAYDPVPILSAAQRAGHPFQTPQARP
jgi:3-phytase